jgi:hypothetical protein
LVSSLPLSHSPPWRPPRRSRFHPLHLPNLIFHGHATLRDSLDFKPGLDLVGKVRSSFSTPVCLSSGSDGFLLCVSFGRANFLLDLDHVTLVLQFGIGGPNVHLNVVHIRDRVFQITVYSKVVGFMINNLRSYSCHSFICYFHPWGFG